MEYNKINNLLGNTKDKISKYVTKNWIKIHDHSGNSYNAGKSIKFKTQMLRSNLCDYSDAYILVKGKITIISPNNDGNFDRYITFKNNASFISCI